MTETKSKIFLSRFIWGRNWTNSGMG